METKNQGRERKKENLKEMREVLFCVCLFWEDAKSSASYFIMLVFPKAKGVC